MYGQNGRAEQICKRAGQLFDGRTNWLSHWQEIAERVEPNLSTSFLTAGFGATTQGEKRTQHQYDATANIALGRFASSMESMLTPRNQKWHRVKASLPELNKDRAVRLWFEQVNDLMFKYRYAPKANFQSQNRMSYRALGAFGTAALFIDKLIDRTAQGLRYRSIHLGEIVFCENHQGIIDTACRKFEMEARQIVQKWGNNPAIPDKIKQCCTDNGQADRKFWVIHWVCPREDMDPERLDYKGMPFMSLYVLQDDKVELEEGGYESFPYAISRYDTAPGEVYGRSPAMDALPAIKTLNEEKKTLLKQGHRTVDPVLLAHDDGVLDTFSLKPGAINYGGVTADGRPLIHALPVGNIAVGKDLMDDERIQINDAFLVTLFQILVDTPQMTATEVLERAREKGALLSPTMGRQQSEYLGPMIERELDVLAAQGLLPPMPPLLREAAGEYEIEYDSPLSRAQRAEEAAGLMRTVQFAVEVAANTQNPEPLDAFNWDVIIPDLADIQAVPVKWLNSADQIKAIRDGRNQGTQTQQMIEAGPAMAAVLKATAGKPA